MKTGGREGGREEKQRLKKKPRSQTFLSFTIPESSKIM